ncbi:MULTISPECIES: energy transducer TonB [unclassified Lysobacter]|uniref:energy transducer TonB n=1 Tax=unclassified Lysobacter TaxID=2635362 RepID=UPI0006FC7813|nr:MULTISPECIES: energy transducer TonB [unclassified Lysobacter]KQZ67790.1 hypothetical protein ASD53_00200 [Lysobacter sp. Root559]KRC38117.1 hypothetical protein ASE10_00555 [Lysobacter sp. Root76]KRD69442.1 hypothetical protein ASE45_09845 [Lysobacter sp. Root96]
MSRSHARGVTAVLALALLSPFAGLHAQTPPPPPPPDWDGVTPLPAPRVADPRLRQRDPEIKRPMRVSYPDAQACLRISGTAIVIVAIDEKGQVQDVYIERSTRDRMLDRAAMNAARETRWSPDIFNGKAAPSRVRIPVDFVLPPVSSESCQRVSVALIDAEGAAQLTPPPAGQPLRAKIGLYVPKPLQLELMLRRADPNAGTDPSLYPVVHEERRALERPSRAEFSSFDYATPQPLSAGRYLLEVRVDGELRSSTLIEVR